MAGPIDFYFDFSSPYAYLGSHLIEPVAAKHGRELLWHPFMLGIAMKGEKTFPLTEYPMKGDYSRMDFERTARYHNIPFVKIGRASCRERGRWRGGAGCLGE